MVALAGASQEAWGNVGVSLRILTFSRRSNGAARATFPLVRLSLAVTLSLAFVAVTASARAQTVLRPEDAIAHAIRANPDLQAALLDALAAREARRAEEYARNPSFVASADGQHAERFSGTVAGPVRNADQGVSGSVGLRYTTEWGTVVSLDVGADAQWRQVNRDPSTTTSLTIGPNYVAQSTLSARQPLLRGAGADATLAALDQARASERQAQHARDDAATGVVGEVLGAYWELWYADRALEVERAGLAMAEQQLADARTRAETLGTVARTDVLQFATALASLRENIATAEATRASRAIELGRLLGVSPGAATAIRADLAAPPAASPADERVLLEAAARSSPTLLALAAQVDAARLRVVAARDARLPQLDLTTSLALGGLWADDDLPGLQLPGDRPAIIGAIGLALELPLGRSRQDADLSRARLQLDAARARYQASAQNIAASVATLRHTLVATNERVALVGETAQMSADLAEDVRQKLLLGTATPFEVVQAQQVMRETQLRRLRALVDAATASVGLERASGGLLARFTLTRGGSSR